jgi:hypothetical protein
MELVHLRYTYVAEDLNYHQIYLAKVWFCDKSYETPSCKGQGHGIKQAWIMVWYGLYQEMCTPAIHYFL